MTKTVQDYSNELSAAIALRADFEMNKSADNTSIQECLTKLAKSVSHDTIASIMMQSNVDADFINKSERVNNRFNVYAAEKVANVARAIAVVNNLNHYTLAIFKTALALESASFTLSHKSAVAACSASVKHSDAKQERLIKTTRYAKHVAANTASTQASSSINALQQFNVFVETRDAANAIAYTIDRTSYAAIALAAKLELSLAVATIESDAIEA